MSNSQDTEKDSSSDVESLSSDSDFSSSSSVSSPLPDTTSSTALTNQPITYTMKIHVANFKGQKKEGFSQSGFASIAQKVHACLLSTSSPDITFVSEPNSNNPSRKISLGDVFTSHIKHKQDSGFLISRSINARIIQIQGPSSGKWYNDVSKRRLHLAVVTHPLYNYPILIATFHGHSKDKSAVEPSITAMLAFLSAVSVKYQIPLILAGDLNCDIRKVMPRDAVGWKCHDYEMTDRRKNKKQIDWVLTFHPPECLWRIEVADLQAFDVVSTLEARIVTVNNMDDVDSAFDDDYTVLCYAVDHDPLHASMIVSTQYVCVQESNCTILLRDFNADNTGFFESLSSFVADEMCSLNHRDETLDTALSSEVTRKKWQEMATSCNCAFRVGRFSSQQQPRWNVIFNAGAETTVYIDLKGDSPNIEYTLFEEHSRVEFVPTKLPEYFSEFGAAVYEKTCQHCKEELEKVEHLYIYCAHHVCQRCVDDGRGQCACCTNGV